MSTLFCTQKSDQKTFTVKIIAKAEEYTPVYATDGAAGCDLKAAVSQDVIIQPGCTALIPTGIFLEMPKNIEAQVRPRSGLALKNAITVLNSPGTIDSDYRGEVGVILINHSTVTFTVTPNMRIAQLVFAELPKIELAKVDAVTESARSTQGFGHTGTH